MRILAPAALAALMLPAVAQAQAADPMPTYDPDEAYQGAYDEYDAPAYDAPYAGDYDAPYEGAYDAPLSQRLSDPAMQDRLASTVAVLGEVLLDMPLAPLVEPMARATGRQPGSVDPDLTLRKMSPRAGDVSARVAQDLPRAMDAMGAMAGSIEAMRPALQGMADRMRAAMEEARRR
jgi:hypothetical protein